MTETDARPASALPRAVLRKTPPQGLRLRRFKRSLAALRASSLQASRPLGLRKPAVRA